jgi:adenine-specific DNA-methyltransferase
LDYFRQLIYGLKSKFIVVSYNNTYSSKSKSSKKKMTLEEIKNVLNERGITKIFKTKHAAFNSGKTDFEDHMEMLFVTKVGK